MTDVSELLGARPQELPDASVILGARPPDPPVVSSDTADQIMGASLSGHVLRAFGQGAETAWDHGENLGFSDDVNEALKKAGVYQDVTEGQGGLLRAFNEAMIRPVVAGTFGLAGAIGRGMSAVVAGGQAAVAAAGEDIGAPGLGRELAAVPEAFPAAGAETGGLHGVPIPPRAELLGRELGGALSTAEIDRAADLGVIGPKARDSWQDTTYGGPVTATQGSITPTVTARIGAIQDAAREQQTTSAAPAEPPPAPTDIHEAARAIAPDTFAQYDPLQRQMDLIRQNLAESKAQQQADVIASAPHQAEIADLQERLQDTTPRLAKKYQARLDQIVPERDAFLADQDRIAGLMRDTPEQQSMRRLLLETDFQMRDLAPNVSAAYREAAKQFPETQVEPAAGVAGTPATEPEIQAAPSTVQAPVVAEPVAAPAEAPAPQPAVAPPGAAGGPVRPVPVDAAQPLPTAGTVLGVPIRREGAPAVAEPAAAAPPAEAVAPPESTPAPVNIRDDVAAKLVAAGRPAEEAQAAAAVSEALWRTRAAAFEGRKGTAEEMYAREGADIRAGRQRARTPEMAQQVTRGKIKLTDGRAIITLMRGGNASTFIHETGHEWVERLLGDAKDTEAPQHMRDDAATVRKWLGAGDGDLTTAQHERFARGFERYMMEGHAPSRALDGVFAKFREWLTTIYQTVAKLRAPISDDIRGVFDRMLATQPDRAVIAPEREIVTRTPEPKTPFMPTGKEPMRLASFIRKMGGVKDEGGDIKAMLGSYRFRPGLVKDTGTQQDIMHKLAWQAGYFPEHESPFTLETNDFLDRLREDLNGNPQYSGDDIDRVQAYQAALAHNAEVDRLATQYGIDTKGLTQEQFFDAVADKMTVEEQAEAIKDAEAAHESAFDEASAETKAWLEDHNVPWTADEFYGIAGPRTLEELEAERGQETASRPAGQGQADDRDAVAAGRDQGQGEGSRGPRGRGAGPSGRADEGASGGQEPVGRPTQPRPRPEQPDSPHAAVEEPSELVDKAGNIRLDNLNSDDDIKQVLRDLAAQNDDFMAARGGVIPDVQRSAMADGLGLTMDNFDPRKPDGVSSSVWADAVQKLTFQAADAVSQLGAIAGESGAPADLAAYLAAKQRLLMIADHFATLTAEAGRTLRVFDKAGFKFVDDLIASMQQETGRTLYQMQQEARAVGALKTTAQRSKMMQDTREMTRWQKIKTGIISYFINNLISGPLTHAAYAVGNEVTALFKAVPLTLAEATIDTARSAFGAAPADRVYYGEVGAQIYAHGVGMWKGFSPGWAAFKSGIAYMPGAERLAEAEGGAQVPGLLPALPRQQSIPGRVGHVLETPSRAVSAIHTVMYSMNYEREIARRAFRAASNEGLTGDAFNTRVAQLTQDPPIGMVQAAHDEAMAAVLMTRPKYGSPQQKIVSVINESLPLKLAMPFMQIGMNILDEGLIKNTPLGLASQTVRDNLFGRNGDVARTQQYARIMVGSGLVAGVMTAAAQGVLTGAGPTDPRERALKEAEGWKAYSIRIGDTYIPYRKYLGPLGPLVGGAASIYETGHLLSQGEVSKAVGSGVLGFAQTVLDETWMAGLSQLVDAVTHWDTDGEKYLRNLALDFMPFSVGSQQVARLVDQYQREVHSWTAAARNKLPGLSEGLMPQRDWTGTPIGSHTMMSPSVFQNDRTMQAMEAAEFYPAKILRTVRGVPLNDQQYDDLSRVAGRLAKMRMDNLVATPGFLQLPAGLQREQMDTVLKTSRKVAEDWLMVQPGNENIIRQATEAKGAQVRGALPREVKAVRQGVGP